MTTTNPPVATHLPPPVLRLVPAVFTLKQTYVWDAWTAPCTGTPGRFVNVWRDGHNTRVTLTWADGLALSDVTLTHVPAAAVAALLTALVQS